MAHILCITTGYTGILNATIEAMSRLRDAGHRVSYASTLDVRSQVEAQGLRYFQLPPHERNPAPAHPAHYNKLQRFWEKLAKNKERRTRGIQTLHMDEFREFLTVMQPDVVLSDMELAEHIVTVYTEKIPVAILSPWFAVLRQPGRPPLASLTIPGIGVSGRAMVMRLEWLLFNARRWYKTRFWRYSSLWTDRASIIRAYARQQGFPVKVFVQSNWVLPFAIRGLPVWSMTPRELEFPSPTRPELNYVGPMVHERRNDAWMQAHDKAAMDRVREIRRATGQPLVYCTLGSMMSKDLALLKKIKDAAAIHPEWLVVISLGGLFERDALEHLPSNVYLLDWAAQIEILRESDCAIHHAGINTIHECIHFQVPMLIYSGEYSDENGCAARMKYHGLAIVGNKQHDQPHDIAEKISRLLTDKSIKAAMRRAQLNSARYRDQQIIEKSVNALLRKPTDCS